MEEFGGDPFKLFLWRLFVFGVPAIPAIWMAMDARKKIESRIACVGIGFAAYGICAFFWLGILFWLILYW